MKRCLASVLLVLASSPFVVAQQDRNNNCQLIVRVRTSQEWSIETPIEVDVLIPQGVFATATLVGDASAAFQVPSGANYRLRVSGTGIETVTGAYFGIEALEQEHTETIHVIPLKQNSGTESKPGPTSISISELNIPKDAGAEMKKGLDAYAKGEMDAAAGHFEKAAAQYPHFARAYDLLGTVAIKDANRVKAREQFTKSIDADPTYLPAYVDLARMDLQDRQYAEAESLLNKAVGMNPSLPEAVALLATAEFMNKEYDKGLADVQRMHALRNHEQFAEVHLMAGKVLRMQNQREAAIIQFQLFLKEKPESAEREDARKALASLEAGRKR